MSIDTELDEYMAVVNKVYELREQIYDLQDEIFNKEAELEHYEEEKKKWEWSFGYPQAR